MESISQLQRGQIGQVAVANNRLMLLWLQRLPETCLWTTQFDVCGVKNNLRVFREI